VAGGKNPTKLVDPGDRCRRFGLGKGFGDTGLARRAPEGGQECGQIIADARRRPELQAVGRG
jgi:hypothetical protein